MAAARAAESGKLLLLPASNIKLTIMEGNIIETHAEAVTTGEDRSLEGHGSVSKLLIKTCPKAYKRAREQLKKHTTNFEFGKIYPCTFPNPRNASGRKEGVSFSVVLHAIVPSAIVVTNQSQWMNQMKVLYYNLFKAANNQGKASLALPLLGSGQAGASTDVAVDVLAHALTTFRMKQDVQGLRHPLRDIILYLKKDAFLKMVSKVEEKLRAMPPPPNGIVPPASAQSSSSMGSARPRSTSSKKRNSGSGRGKSRTERKKVSPGESAAAAAGASQDGVSNMSLILQGLTLESIRGAVPQKQEEEDMDCSEFVDELADGEDESTGTEGDDDDEDEEHKCAICLDDMVNPKKLDKCGHIFCRECIEDSFKHHKPVCPSCNTVYGVITGNQPQGTMTMTRSAQGLPGFENCGQIIIDYNFPSGIQGSEHPNPGQPYHGTGRRAFLPDSAEGRKVYRLLRVAFEKRLTFTIGRSVTTGCDNVVTWNDIHHKTRPNGGATGFGYPDPHYLSRVQEELAAKGVTEECLQGRSFDL